MPTETTPEELLGLQTPTTRQNRIDLVRKGLNYEQLQRLQDMLDLSIDELARALAINPRTLRRRRKNAEQLTQEESDKVMRMARVYAHALSFFRTQEQTTNWFKSNVPALNGRRPLDMFDTDEGATLVNDIIGRAEHGIYT